MGLFILMHRVSAVAEPSKVGCLDTNEHSVFYHLLLGAEIRYAKGIPRGLSIG